MAVSPSNKIIQGDGAGGEGEESMAVVWIKQNDPPPAYLAAPISGQFLTVTDTTPPTAVSNLAVDPNLVGVSWLWVKWTAPSDPGNTNSVAYYDLRYSTQTITSNNWASATPEDRSAAGIRNSYGIWPAAPTCGGAHRT